MNKKKTNVFNRKFNDATEQVRKFSELAQKADIDKTVEPDNSKTAKLLNSEEEEKATDKTTTYFKPSQTEKLARLCIEYKKRTTKRIDPNKVLRKLIDSFSFDELLEILCK
mgnify:CR=1 FL=1